MSSTSLTIFSLNWADFPQPVNELDQTADHPALSPSLAILDGEKKRQIILADLAPPRGKPAENTHHKSSQTFKKKLLDHMVFVCLVKERQIGRSQP
jgi:hypothetical protein